MIRYITGRIGFNPVAPPVVPTVVPTTAATTNMHVKLMNMRLTVNFYIYFGKFMHSGPESGGKVMPSN